MAEPDESEQVRCPHCDGLIEVRVAERAEVASCPHCGIPFTMPSADGTAADAREGEESDKSAAHEPDDLDGLRIRQVYQMRRSLYRTRRYWLVGAGLSIVAAGQIIWKFFSPEGWVAMSRVQVVVLAVACLVGGFFCIRQAWELGREAGKSVLGEPDRPPDFSGLSDGSQHWKNLEAMGRGDGDQPL
jgi:hypothetical protein